MNILPYRKFTYNSPLSENEIRNRLNCLTRAANAFRVKYYPNIKTSDYEGTVCGYLCHGMSVVDTYNIGGANSEP